MVNKRCRNCHKSLYIHVMIPADLSATGTNKIKLTDIDLCLAPIIKALNYGGILTRGCCCGHGKRPAYIQLQDGREIIIKEPWKEKSPFITQKLILKDIDNIIL